MAPEAATASPPSLPGDCSASPLVIAPRTIGPKNSSSRCWRFVRSGSSRIQHSGGSSTNAAASVLAMAGACAFVAPLSACASRISVRHPGDQWSADEDQRHGAKDRGEAAGRLEFAAAPLVDQPGGQASCRCRGRIVATHPIATVPDRTSGPAPTMSPLMMAPMMLSMKANSLPFPRRYPCPIRGL
ncbi:MAG: hypothetical protein R3E09_00490 [Novosphingobium sp.]